MLGCASSLALKGSLAASQTASQVCSDPLETRPPGCEVIIKVNCLQMMENSFDWRASESLCMERLSALK